jgi:uncharacterized NAD-dependent epimerase/dehydratase family protein
MDGNAIILTNGLLHDSPAKTAHGLIRGTDRYRILAAIDSHSAGRDAGEVVDGVPRGIPVFATFADFFASTHDPVQYCVIGLATKGGKLPSDLRETVKEVLSAGIAVVSGLHDFLSDQPDLSELAARHQTSIIDVRKPKPKSELHFWTGRIFSVSCPRVAVLGTDCAIGKRTTSRLLTQACRQAGLRAQMIYTGQTGWMQGGRYGFVLDSTLNDFVGGELEHAIVSCFEEMSPDVIFLEGQAALRNPSGPCGSEFLISGQVKEVVLQHAPGRVYYSGWEHLGLRLPPLSEEIDLIRAYGARTLAVTLNPSGLTAKETQGFKEQYEQELGVPVVLPLEEGVDRIVPLVQELIKPTFGLSTELMSE